MPSPGERVAVSESMNRDLNRVSMWCNLWGMKQNASNTKTMIVSSSCTVHPLLTPLTLDRTVLKGSADLVILGVTFDAKMTFENHLASVSSATAQRLGIMRKSRQLFHDRSLLLRSFGALSCRFWSIAQQCGKQMPTHTLNYLNELAGGLIF